MYPYLFEINLWGHIIRPPTYGILLAFSFSLAYIMSLKRAVKEGVDPRHIENLFLVVILSAIVGSRLFHVFFEEWSYYSAHPEKIIAVWEGGYTLYGAILSCMLGIFLYTKIRKVPFYLAADIITPPVALGIFFGRIGCFAAGCCWGRPTNLPWGVRFTHPDSFCDVKNVPLHPSQLYESLGCLLIFFYLQWLSRRRKYIGQVYCHGLIIYAVLRFAVEHFRGDDYRGYLFNGLMSYSQFVSLVILPFAIWAMLRAKAANAKML